MLGLHLRTRQMLASTSFTQSRHFSYKISRVFSPVGSHMSDDPKVLIQEKQKGKSTIETAPGWNEKLASESEARVKADRNDKNNTISIEELQRQSISLMEEHDHKPKSQELKEREN
ncbi:hypothetical protein RclHR1_16910001 [Rhizophagus clarus]|uniref:Uncharacterized protein n=1 Tax=Rhizophagus clarus TaxID=94130 RepID=A0A2Z6QIS3_9GLOM|nr:hypothetical protein RclHR1_16910001 [Rhizophagus clarus]GES96166.1 hypothetical protein RCL_jg500.t1 [Rhizophagus clarus]